ncbi:hypothetical protein [Streptomyces venezuelae]
MRTESLTYEGDHPLTAQPCTMFPDTGAAANSACLPYSRALARRSSAHDVWDLRLYVGHVSPPITIGRIGGDIVERKKTDVLPAVDLSHSTRGATRAKPFFTVTNDLALSLRDVPAG